MNIAIVQVYDEKIACYSQYSTIINQIYAVGHGYSYFCWDHSIVPLYVSVYYNKIKAIYTVMMSDMQPDWILYMDTDAIITNFSINIEDIINRHENQEVIYGMDLNGKNSGVILIKNTQAMRDYLQDCYNDTSCYHTRLPEQTALFKHAELKKYKDLVGFETMHFFNAYLFKYADMQYDERLWDRESFILHLQQISDKEKIAIFKQHLAKMKLYHIDKKEK